MKKVFCSTCGGAREIEDSSTDFVCEYCGLSQHVHDELDPKAKQLLEMANALRYKGEFDRASKLYNNVVAIVPSCYEAHWGLALCTYGVEYVDDPKTGKKIPTCHRLVTETIANDVNYLEAVKYADELTKEHLANEAIKIDELEKKIVKISMTEEPYDVFISYKETDKDGERTEDSQLAFLVYNSLTEKGYKVFYARETLKGKLGVDYEPYIYSALNTSRVMIVLGTSVENMNAIWVKNEWSRFLTMMKFNNKKYIIPCYKDFEAYDLPEELVSYQASNMADVAFVPELVHTIEKLFEKFDDEKIKKANEQKEIENEEEKERNKFINAINAGSYSKGVTDYYGDGLHESEYIKYCSNDMGLALKFITQGYKSLDKYDRLEEALTDVVLACKKALESNGKLELAAKNITLFAETYSKFADPKIKEVIERVPLDYIDQFIEASKYTSDVLVQCNLHKAPVFVGMNEQHQFKFLEEDFIVKRLKLIEFNCFIRGGSKEDVLELLNKEYEASKLCHYVPTYMYYVALEIAALTDSKPDLKAIGDNIITQVNYLCEKGYFYRQTQTGHSLSVEINNALKDLKLNTNTVKRVISSTTDNIIKGHINHLIDKLNDTYPSRVNSSFNGTESSSSSSYGSSAYDSALASCRSTLSNLDAKSKRFDALYEMKYEKEDVVDRLTFGTSAERLLDVEESVHKMLFRLEQITDYSILYVTAAKGFSRSTLPSFAKEVREDIENYKKEVSGLQSNDYLDAQKFKEAHSAFIARNMKASPASKSSSGSSNSSNKNGSRLEGFKSFVLAIVTSAILIGIVVLALYMFNW